MKKRIARSLCILLSGLILVTSTACASVNPDGDSSSTTKNPTETTQGSEIESTEETTDIEKESTLMITAPKGEVFPYLDRARKYLEAGKNANVGKKFEHIPNPQVPITVKWITTDENITHYTVEYATQSDFSDAITKQVEHPATSLDLYNLYKSTTYYVRITSYRENEEVSKAESKIGRASCRERV